MATTSTNDALADLPAQAIERSREAIDAQNRRVDESFQRFTDHLGKPWKFKADSLREALDAGTNDDATTDPTIA